MIKDAGQQIDKQGVLLEEALYSDTTVLYDSPQNKVLGTLLNDGVSASSQAAQHCKFWRR